MTEDDPPDDLAEDDAPELPEIQPGNKKIHESLRTLPPKQALFVIEYLIDMNATQAAIRAGYSEMGASATGSRLLGYLDVQTAVQDGSLDALERGLVSHSWVINRLKDVYRSAMKRTGAGYANNAAAANRALELIGKHGGMWVEGVAGGDVNIQINLHPHGEGE